MPGDGIPPAKFVEVMADPEQAARVVEGGQLHTGYITLNTQIPPFDNVDVRKAVNMAINKERITQIINGRAVPATQPLPPSMPGYTDNYEGYAFDPEGYQGDAGRGVLRGRVRDRAFRDEHRPQPTHRPCDPAGPGLRSASTPRSSRWPRPTSSRRAARPTRRR